MPIWTLHLSFNIFFIFFGLSQMQEFAYVHSFFFIREKPHLPESALYEPK